MKNLSVSIKILFLISLLSLVLFLVKDVLNQSLFFVDAGRFAIVGRSLVKSGEFRSLFEFYPHSVSNLSGWVTLLPPFPIIIDAFFMRLLGISDTSIILQSFTFYILSALAFFLLSKKVLGVRLALISVTIFLFSPQFLSYAKDGGTEPLFTTLIVLISYLIYKNTNFSILISGFLMSLLLFSKLQSYLFVPIFIFWIFWQNGKKFSLSTYVFFFPILFLVLNKLGILFGYYKIWLPTYILFQQSSIFPSDILPRSNLIYDINGSFVLENLKVLLSKSFYNIYNFYKGIFVYSKILPDLAPPFIVIFYLLSNLKLLYKEDLVKRRFRIIVVLMLLGSIILSSITSPQMRYLHPLIPFLIIFAIDLLNDILEKLDFNLSKKDLIYFLLIGLFFVIPFLGSEFLDSRYNVSSNVNKPYSFVLIGKSLGELTLPSSITMTNLQTWGSWYGNRKTILITPNFKILKDLDGINRIDYVFLTSYQRDNPDRPLNGDWGALFDKPETVSNNFIQDNFVLSKVATVSADQDYENQDFTYKLWTRK